MSATRPNATGASETPAATDAVDAVATELARGAIVVVADTEDPSGAASAVLGCQFATHDSARQLAERSGGPVRLALTEGRAEELGLLASIRANESGGESATVGARQSPDRLERGLMVAIDPEAAPDDLVPGGPLVPVAARAGGVLERAGAAEAAIDLARAAGIVAACALVPVDDAPDGAPRITMAELIAHRMRHERTISRRARARLPTRWAEFTAIGYDTALDGRHHLALTLGELDPSEPVLVRVHAERILSDRFGGWGAAGEIGRALEAIASEGGGVFVYVGRQDRGLDPLGGASARPASASALLRDYGIGAQILVDLGLQSIRILTDHPRQIVGLAGYGIEVVGFEPLSEEQAESA